MTSKQFHFSVSTGILLTLLGAVIVSKAPIGIGLIGLGIAILMLSILTKNNKHQNAQMPSLPIPIEQTQQSNRPHSTKRVR